MARQARITLNSREIVLEVKLAQQIGVNEALVLRQLYWRVTTYEEDKCDDKCFDGLYWLSGTLPAICEMHFPFWDVQTLRRTFQRLKERGLILIYEGEPGSKTGNRYTINREQVAELARASAPDKSKRGRPTEPIPAGDPYQLDRGNEAQEGYQIDTPTPINLSGVQREEGYQIDSPTPINLIAQNGSSSYKESLDSCIQTLLDSNNNTDGSANAPQEKAETVVVEDSLALIDSLIGYGIWASEAAKLAAWEGLTADTLPDYIAALPYFKPGETIGNKASFLAHVLRQRIPLPKDYLADKRKREQVSRVAVKVQAEKAVTVSDEHQADADRITYECLLEPERLAELAKQTRAGMPVYQRERYDKWQKAGCPSPMPPLFTESWKKARNAVLTKWMAQEGSNDDRND